jgi:hypothetical protein
MVQVSRIDPAKHPDFKRDPDHPFSGMEAGSRLREIVSFCARLWARTCREAIGGRTPAARVAA